MRNTFAEEINKLAIEDKNIILLSGDIGNRMFDKLKKTCPNQFINCGIAEANMMSMAAGMGLCGLKPIIYTITPFTTLRCLEQIKIGIGYHNSPVIIVGTGSGLSYSELGPTHHSLEDIAIIKTIPGINILTPADSLELKAFLNQAIKARNPTYIRIGKKGEPNINFNSKITIGSANFLKNGKDVVLIGIGPILEEAIKASDLLKEKGIDMAVVSMGSIRPLDLKFLQKLKDNKFTKWITLEEHGIIGGLGSSIIEWLSQNELNNEIKINCIATPTKFINELGDQKYIRKKLNMDSESIKEFILKL